MSQDREDRAQLIVSAPILFFACLVLSGGLTWFCPISLRGGFWPVRLVLSCALFGAAGLLAFSGFWVFREHRTPFDPGRPTVKVIQNGPFRYSRNPLYLALILLWAAVMFLTASLWMLFFLVVLFLLLHYGVIKPEEQYLEAKFGSEYTAYKARVRRWL